MASAAALPSCSKPLLGPAASPGPAGMEGLVVGLMTENAASRWAASRAHVLSCHIQPGHLLQAGEGASQACKHVERRCGPPAAAGVPSAREGKEFSPGVTSGTSK